jgi:chemotaxis methyl-accepting protein methylase
MLWHTYFKTFFSDQMRKQSGLNITVLACSIGAEVYSIVWTLRSGQPGLKMALNAVDISKEALEFGENGVYPLGGGGLTDEKIFARVIQLLSGLAR